MTKFQILFSGELKALWSHDREEKDEYQLTVTAEDGGQVRIHFLKDKKSLD